jgi:Protein of unknown function (DUF2849)
MSKTAKPRPIATTSVITANRLCDGSVVWFACGETWAEVIDAAIVVHPDTADAMLALARLGEVRQQVVGVYPVEVAPDRGRPMPTRFRERLRLTGPSVAAEPAEWRPESGPRT